MTIVKFNFPPGGGQFAPAVQTSAAVPNPPVLAPDGNGQCNVDLNVVQEMDLLNAGFTYPVSLSGATGARPSPAYPGMLFFDATLGKPVFRNAANSGWVDATGTLV